MEEGAIRLGSMKIGTVQLDPTDIRGEGDEYDPRLVIPIKIELDQQSREHQIFIVRLTASLHLNQTGQAPSHDNQFSSKVSYDLINDMLICSIHSGPNNRLLDLCFNLTHAQLKKLENMRHDPGRNLYLRLEPIIAWSKHTGNLDSTPYGGGSTLEEDGWHRYVGQFSYFAFFQLPKADALRLDLAAMDWVGKIYPGIGYDNFRLIEVKLPASDSHLISKDAVEHFKEAKQDYDTRQHRDCLTKCRLVHEAVEKAIEVHLSARLGKDYKIRDHKLGEAIALDLGWTSDSEQEKFLNGAWKPLYVMANAADHTPSTKSLLPADAHTVLISTAAMLEYLAQLE